jgi:hypothetical protein
VADRATSDPRAAAISPTHPAGKAHRLLPYRCGSSMQLPRNASRPESRRVLGNLRSTERGMSINDTVTPVGQAFSVAGCPCRTHVPQVVVRSTVAERRSVGQTDWLPRHGRQSVGVPLLNLDGASLPRCELTIQVPDLRGSRYGRVVLPREVWT